MIVKVVQCNHCGRLHDFSKDATFDERDYVGLSDTVHFCKDCAKEINIYDYIKGLVDANKSKQ